jgi:hypothetical protein
MDILNCLEFNKKINELMGALKNLLLTNITINSQLKNINEYEKKQLEEQIRNIEFVREDGARAAATTKSTFAKARSSILKSVRKINIYKEAANKAVESAQEAFDVASIAHSAALSKSTTSADTAKAFDSKNNAEFAFKKAQVAKLVVDDPLTVSTVSATAAKEAYDAAEEAIQHADDAISHMKAAKAKVKGINTTKATILLEEAKKLIDSAISMPGGGNNDLLWKEKYLKYKTKYFNLKAKLT